MSKESQEMRRQMIWGILIICVGVVFLVGHNDWVELSRFWRYWPFVVIAFGINNMIPPTTGKRFMDGVFEISFALWFYVSFEHIWGLSFRNSWPFLVIMAGVSLVVQPIVIKYFDNKKEM
ncbi:LiaI-LiaF-like domain-containing protein [Pseudoduganella sp. UC29_106]|uniref:LiaF transmembrane domain-containing protein n=1 Tax=Pseudoduganella sp. UC29_106 TaxID=3374553 RepID=UPI003757BD90